jgi:hypothetical protein
MIAQPSQDEEDIFDQIALDQDVEPHGVSASPPSSDPVAEPFASEACPHSPLPSWPPSAAVVSPPPSMRIGRHAEPSVVPPSASTTSQVQSPGHPAVSDGIQSPPIPVPSHPSSHSMPLQKEPRLSSLGSKTSSHASTHMPQQSDSVTLSHAKNTPSSCSGQPTSAARIASEGTTHAPLPASGEPPDSDSISCGGKRASSTSAGPSDGPPAPSAASIKDSRTFVSLSGPPSGTAALLSEVVATGNLPPGGQSAMQRGGSDAITHTSSGAAGEWLHVQTVCGKPSEVTGGRSSIDGLKAEWLHVHTVQGEAPMATGSGVDAFKAALRSAQRAVNSEPAIATAMQPLSPTPRSPPQPQAAPVELSPSEHKAPPRRRGGLFGLLAGRSSAVDAQNASPRADMVVDSHAVATSILEAARAQAASTATKDTDTPGPPQVAAELLRLEGLRKQLARMADVAVAEAAQLRDGQQQLLSEVAAAQEACSAAREERDCAREHVMDTHRCLLRALQDVVILRGASSR